MSKSHKKYSFFPALKIQLSGYFYSFLLKILQY